MPDTPKISIFSCGWSEGSEFKEMLLSQGAFLFDISNIQSDHDAHAPRWKHFGGDGSDLDEELGQIDVLRDLVTRLEELIQCHVEAIDCNRVLGGAFATLFRFLGFAGLGTFRKLGVYVFAVFGITLNSCSRTV